MKITLTDKNGNQVLAVESVKALSYDEKEALYKSDKYKKSKTVLKQIYDYLIKKYGETVSFHSKIQGSDGNIIIDGLCVDWYYNQYGNALPIHIGMVCNFNEYNETQKQKNKKYDWSGYLNQNFNKVPSKLSNKINEMINDISGKFKLDEYGIVVDNNFVKQKFFYSWYGWKGDMIFYWLDIKIDETATVFSSDVSKQLNNKTKIIDSVLALPEVKQLALLNGKEIFTTKFANTDKISVKYYFYKSDFVESVKENGARGPFTIGQLSYSCANDDIGAFDDFDVLNPAFKAFENKFKSQKLKIKLDDYSDDETVYILASFK